MNEIDGDFRKVRQLVHKQTPLSPAEPMRQTQMWQQRLQQRDHQWKSPIQRYRNKRQLSNSAVDENDNDDDLDELEELSWKHRSKAYDITLSDVTSKRVYHWNWNKSSDSEDENETHHSKGFQKKVSSSSSKRSSHHYTNRRPKSIETTSATKILEGEQVPTPDTIPMDADEFDSPCYGSTPTGITSLESSSPAVVTPTKAILDLLAMNHNNEDSGSETTRKESSSQFSEGTEVTLKMFEEDNSACTQPLTDGPQTHGALQNIEEEKVFEKVQGAVNKILVERSGVEKLIEEHERLMAETQMNIAATPNSAAANSGFITVRKSKSREKETISSPSEKDGTILERGKGYNSGEKFVHASTGETKTALEQWCETWTDRQEGIAGDKIASEEFTIIFDDEEEEEDDDESFLPRSSILTTIVEELTPLKSSSPPLQSPKTPENDSKVMRTNFREARAQALNVISPERLERDTKEVYTRKEFKELKIKKLNKVTIAAALIEFNAAVMEETQSLHPQRITNDIRLTKAIKKHRMKNGCFTGTTPTKESMKKNAAIAIQTSCRQFLAAQNARRKLFAVRTFAATLIQAQWRAYDSRMDYKWHRGSAAILQATLRSFVCKNKFESFRSSTILVQSIARMHLCRVNYLKCQVSAKIFQTQWRSYICQKQFETLCSSTILVQSITRMHLCRINYLKCQGSAKICQTQWRSHICQKQYESIRSSSILVQSIVRMRTCRVNYLKCQGSAEIVQTQWRSYIGQKQYKSLRSSTILVQSIARMQLYRTEFIQLKASAIAIQAVSRKCLCRTRYIECKQAVTTLQAVSRMYLCHAKFLRQKRAATSLQAVLRTKICRSNYIECKKAAIKLQSLSRMHLSHAKYLEDKKATVTLQAVSRMNLCRSKYVKCKKAAIITQSLSRTYICRAKFLEQKSASTTIQSALRMHHCRSSHIESKEAVMYLQAKSRMFLCRIMYLKQQRAAIILQGVLRMHRYRSKYVVHQSAALVIQSAFREHVSQKDYITFEALREVQARWKSSVCKDDYMTLMEIKKIPTSSRTSICKRNFIHHLSSSIIQTGWRLYTRRKTFEAARCIQTRWRAFVFQKRLNSTKASARLLQSNYRSYVCKKEYSRILKSTRKLQSIWRSYTCKKEYTFSVLSATKLQSSFRAYTCRQKYAILVSNRAAVKLESIARMHLCRTKFVEYKASRTIQAVSRMHLRRTKLLACCKAIITIQASFRAFACRKQYALNLESVKMTDEQHNAWAEDKEEFVGGSQEFNEHALYGPMNSGYNDFFLDDEDDEGTFLGRSSTLTTIVEDRSPLHYTSSPDESAKSLSKFSYPETQNSGVDQFETESKILVHPAVIQKKEPDVVVEEKLQEESYKMKEPVQVESKKETTSSYDKAGEVENRRSSEERLLALAAKVAKRRASLNTKRLELTTRDPWQNKKELQKKSKPVLLSKRISELDKLSKQKRVTGSRWNTKEEQNARAVGDVDNEPLVRYPTVLGDQVIDETRDTKEDSIVKKLFDGTNLSGKHSEDDSIEHQEIDDIGDVHSDFSDMDENEEQIDSVSRVGFSDDIHTRSFEIDMDGNGDENSADYERKDVIRSWGRRSIVDDLADDIYNFETVSDNDDVSVSSDDTERKGVYDTSDDIIASKIIPENDDVIAEEIPDPDQIEVKENAAKTHTGWKEWSVVNDLIDDVDTQLDGGYADGYDSDEDGNELTKETAVNSRLSIMNLFQTVHSFWT